MQIVINIPEELYEAYKGRPPMLGDEGMDMIAQAIANGTPLRKGHGRLADMDEAIKCIEEVNGEDAVWAIGLINWACSKRTILEADKAESEANTNFVDDIFGQMRDATEQEQKSVSEFVESISKPTGVNFYDKGRK